MRKVVHQSYNHKITTKKHAKYRTPKCTQENKTSKRGTRRWLSTTHDSSFSGQNIDAGHQTWLGWHHTRHSSTARRTVYRPSSATTVSRTHPSDFSNSVDLKIVPPPEYTPVRPQYHDLENTISRGTPTSRPVLYKTTHQHLRNSNEDGESIQCGLKIILKLKLIICRNSGQITLVSTANKHTK